ncbi:sulfite exporter TauE/SafE family protein [Halorussus halobius]|uniref:sulfite exporter TauE/SafE family protein n=1 Tax=Halorussus halobius TaxID=1710537 RepID=UPI001093199D|nr:sulfite exporter TauE/SafE family protein [Halorussus halobius]
MTTCTPANPLLGTETLGLPVLALVGLLGGAHCIGMCGPLVATYAARMDEGARDDTLTVRAVRQHALFNLGRTASYALLGGLFGLAGQLVFVSLRDLTRVATEVRAATGIGAGLVVAAVGVTYLTGRGARRVPIPGIDRISAAVRTALVPRVDAWVGDYRIAGLGAVHGLLPCPLLYPAYLYAFAQGSALGGVAALAALGAGTIPAVFLTGALFDGLDVGERRRLHRGLGLAFVALGYVPVQHGLAALGVGLPAVPLPSFQPW